MFLAIQGWYRAKVIIISADLFAAFFHHRQKLFWLKCWSRKWFVMGVKICLVFYRFGQIRQEIFTCMEIMKQHGHLITYSIVCQMLSWRTENSLHSINIWDTVSNVVPLCSVSQAPSYEPNLTFLAPFPTELAYLSMLFILEVVCTA